MSASIKMQNDKQLVEVVRELAGNLPEGHRLIGVITMTHENCIYIGNSMVSEATAIYALLEVLQQFNKSQRVERRNLMGSSISAKIN